MISLYGLICIPTIIIRRKCEKNMYLFSPARERKEREEIEISRRRYRFRQFRRSELSSDLRFSSPRCYITFRKWYISGRWQHFRITIAMSWAVAKIDSFALNRYIMETCRPVNVCIANVHGRYAVLLTPYFQLTAVPQPCPLWQINGTTLTVSSLARTSREQQHPSASPGGPTVYVGVFVTFTTRHNSNA